MSPVKINLNSAFDQVSNDSPLKLDSAENLIPDEKRSPFIGFDEEQFMIPVSKQRVIAKNPYKVLDAPALQDDYYLNLVDWSSLNDLVVGL